MAIEPHYRVRGPATTPNSSVLDPSAINVYPPDILTFDATETVSTHHGADSWRKLQFKWDFGEDGIAFRSELISDFWFAGRSRRYAYERMATHAFEAYPAMVGETITRTVRLTVTDVEHPEDNVDVSFFVRNNYVGRYTGLTSTAYVDPVNGNDSWGGRHPTYEGGTSGPKRTLAAALALLASAGDGYQLFIVGDDVTLPITPGQWPISPASGIILVRPYDPAHRYTVQADAAGDLVQVSGYDRFHMHNAKVLGFNGTSKGILPGQQASLVGCEFTNWNQGSSQSGARRDDVGFANCYFHGNAQHNIYAGDDDTDLKERFSIDGCLLEPVSVEHAMRGNFNHSVIHQSRITGNQSGRETLKYHGSLATTGASEHGVISESDLIGIEESPGDIVVICSLPNSGSGQTEEIAKTTYGGCLIRTPSGATNDTRGIEVKISQELDVHDTVFHGLTRGIMRGGSIHGDVVEKVRVRNCAMYTDRSESGWVRMIGTGTSDGIAWGAGNLEVRNCYLEAPNATGLAMMVAGGDTDPANLVIENNRAYLPAASTAARVRINGVNYTFDGSGTPWPGLSGNTNGDADLGLIDPADYTYVDAFKTMAETLGELTSNRVDFYRNTRTGTNWIGVYQNPGEVIPPLVAKVFVRPGDPKVRAIAKPGAGQLLITPQAPVVRAVARPGPGLVRIRPMPPVIETPSGLVYEEDEMIAWAMGLFAGATDKILPVRLLNSSGAELTAVAAGAVIATYWRPGAAPVDIAVSALGAIDAAHTEGGWFEVDATKRPGEYRFDLPDAVLAAGAPWVDISVRTATSRTFHVIIPLDSPAALMDVRQRMVGRVAVDHATNLMTIFEEDGTTPRITLLNRQHPTEETVQELVPQ